MARPRQGGRPTPAWLLVPGVIDSLKAAWIAGTPTAEMGRLFGTTTSAIIGKVHRLGLDPRPSPIRSSSAPRPAPRPYVPPRTLPPLASEQAAVAPAIPAPIPRIDPPAPVAAPITPPAPIAAPIPIPAPIAAPRPTFTRAAECCWPSGEPGTRTFRYCGANSLPGKPYCDKHAKLAFVKVRDRREDSGQRAANAAAMGG